MTARTPRGQSRSSRPWRNSPCLRRSSSPANRWNAIRRLPPRSSPRDMRSRSTATHPPGAGGRGTAGGGDAPRWRRASPDDADGLSPRPRSRPHGQPVELVRRDVLIESEEVLRVVAALQSLESAVLLCAVSLADAILTLVHEEVHVDARMPGLEGRPEAAHPLTLLLEALRAL